MIKKTLYFGNPAYLATRLEQLAVSMEGVEVKTIPIEDIGIVILDHSQITITSSTITKLLENNVALITCNSQHLPTGLMLNLVGNTLQTSRFREQIGVKKPLQNSLWKQTVKMKITNQATLLKKNEKESAPLYRWASLVKPGDPENLEARAAAYYWSHLFKNLEMRKEWSTESIMDFRRDKNGIPPNGVLNYGYAILRAIVARGLVSSGLHPTLGFFHRNQYNPYCLADDVMEPFRPYVDEVVVNLIKEGMDFSEVNKEVKKRLLQIPVLDIHFGDQRSPLMVGMQQTTASLVRCYLKEQKEIQYPLLK